MLEKQAEKRSMLGEANFLLSPRNLNARSLSAAAVKAAVRLMPPPKAEGRTEARPTPLAIVLPAKPHHHLLSH